MAAIQQACIALSAPRSPSRAAFPARSGKRPGAPAGFDAGRGGRRVVLPAAKSAGEVAQGQKRLLMDLVGDNKGFDLSEEQTAQVMQLVEELKEQNPTKVPAEVDLAGTKWECIFTTSKGASSGKIGPFIGRNDQEFPGDMQGKYINTLELGPLRAYLLGVYSKLQDDIIRVEFVEQEFSLGPFKTKKDFEKNAMVGSWKMVYQDDDLRVFFTNKNSLFVMRKK